MVTAIDSDKTFRLDLDEYAQRVGYTGAFTHSVETLYGIHRAQALSVPFENLDIHLGRPIKIDPASIIAKIVRQQRGGYCYEVNGLFLLVLKQLGFSTTSLAARNIIAGYPLRQKSHQITLAELNGRRWLLDLGFGGNNPIEPIPFEINTAFEQFGDYYRLMTDEKFGYVLQLKMLGEWRSLYGFTLEEYYPSDFAMMNYFNSTSPTASFTQQRMCARPTLQNRITLVNYELKIRQRSGEAETKFLEPGAAYLQALKEYFGIELAADTTFITPAE